MGAFLRTYSVWTVWIDRSADQATRQRALNRVSEDGQPVELQRNLIVHDRERRFDLRRIGFDGRRAR